MRVFGTPMCSKGLLISSDPSTAYLAINRHISINTHWAAVKTTANKMKCSHCVRSIDQHMYPLNSNK